MKRALIVCAGISTLALPAVASGSETSAMQVDGTFTTQVVPCDSLCTASEYEGDLEGTTEFALTSLEVTADPDVSRYTGSLVLHTDDGDLVGQDVGYWNTTTGRYLDAYAITSGTGVYQGAVGLLVLRGTLDPVTGTGASTYRGWIYWPTCDD
jgi:hypothetical protein